MSLHIRNARAEECRLHLVDQLRGAGGPSLGVLGELLHEGGLPRAPLLRQRRARGPELLRGLGHRPGHHPPQRHVAGVRVALRLGPGLLRRRQGSPEARRRGPAAEEGLDLLRRARLRRVDDAAHGPLPGPAALRPLEDLGHVLDREVRHPRGRLPRAVPLQARLLRRRQEDLLVRAAPLPRQVVPLPPHAPVVHVVVQEEDCPAPLGLQLGEAPADPLLHELPGSPPGRRVEGAVGSAEPGLCLEF